MVKHMPKSSKFHRAQIGFSMIEALVSILVLSIGLLGVAALQGVGLRANSSANHRSQAAWYAAQIVEEARARRSDVVNQNAGIIGAVAAFGCNLNATTAIDQWRSRIACALPSGAGGVQYSNYTQRLVVTVQWDDSRGVDSANAGGNSAAQFRLETIL